MLVWRSWSPVAVHTTNSGCPSPWTGRECRLSLSRSTTAHRERKRKARRVLIPIIAHLPAIQPILEYRVQGGRRVWHGHDTLGLCHHPATAFLPLTAHTFLSTWMPESNPGMFRSPTAEEWLHEASSSTPLQARNRHVMTPCITHHIDPGTRALCLIHFATTRVSR